MVKHELESKCALIMLQKLLLTLSKKEALIVCGLDTDV